MRIANLVVAIIYSAVLILMFLVAAGDNDLELIVGTIFFSPMLVLNWMSFAKWPKEK